MPANCVNEKALESISWIAGLLKGKTGKDRLETLTFLKDRISAMERDDCPTCPSGDQCQTLDQVAANLEDRPVADDGPTQIGPLMHRRQARRDWLNRGMRWRQGKL